jgi:hypothetical protein
MLRVEFPDRLLVPESGWLSGFVRSGRGFRPNARGEYTAIIPLRPFELPSGHRLAGESATTSLQFEGLRLPAERVGDLEGASFEFSESAADSIVVGELHIALSYVPLVLHRVTFGGIDGGSVDATFEMRVDFEDENGGDESGFLSRDAVVRASLELDVEPALLPGFSLLGGAYRPATESILFLEVAPIEFAEWLKAWIGSHTEAGRMWRRPRRVRCARISGGLADALPLLAPLTARAIRRRLIVPTRSSWTAYLDNSISGTDPSPLSHFSSELSCRAVRVGCSADGTIFELYGSEERDGPFGVPTTWIRHVYAMNDGYWTFEAAGDVQPFERPERYDERRIRDRFTPELLRSYLAALGIRAFDDDFYMPDREASLIEEDIPLYRGERAWSFEEVQQGLPWSREG